MTSEVSTCMFNESGVSAGSHLVSCFPSFLGITLIPIGVTRQVDSDELALISAGSHTEGVDYFILRNPGVFPDTITSQTRDLMVGIASPIVPQPVPVPVPSPVPVPVPSSELQREMPSIIMPDTCI